MKEGFKDERLQNIYDEGFCLGITYGPSKRITRLLGRKEEIYSPMENMKEQEIIVELMSACNELGANVPKILLEELTMKEIQVFIFGYINGKMKNIRNRADKKYHEKIGLISKSYKLHEDVVQAFAEACKEANVSLAATLERLMLEFVEEVISK